MTTPRNILIVGATGAMAEATARLWAAEGARLYLLARNPAKLELVTRDLRLRRAQAYSELLDVDELGNHQRAIDAALAVLGSLDIALIAHGDLPDQRACELDAARAVRSLTTNAVSVVSLVTLIAQHMREKGRGCIVVIGSVAGDRGRKSNYVYGAGKAMVATFLEGLAGRLQGTGVSVVNIKPGFVDSPMTAAFKKGPLWAKPEDIARIIHRRAAAATSGGFYAPRFWWPIMLVVRWMPARLLYRLNI